MFSLQQRVEVPKHVGLIKLSLLRLFPVCVCCYVDVCNNPVGHITSMLFFVALRQ